MVSAPGCGWPRAYCRGVAARWLDTEFCRPRAYGGVSVGLLLGMVVSHPVRERVRACCWRRPGHQGSVKEDHVL